MAKALLINPSYFRTYGSNDGGILFPVVPVLGLTSIAGALKAQGHDCTILDLSYRRYEHDMVADVIRRERPDVVGITATTPLVNQMRDISYLVKDQYPEIVTIGGGSHASAMPVETMQQSALDIVAAGEADFVIGHLLDGRSPSEIPGLYRREGDQIVASPAGKLLEDLDDLPMPAWGDYPPEAAAKVSRIFARYRPCTTLEFSRGCIYRCDFCASKRTMGRGYRKKSPERCAEEFERVGRLGFREVMLTDDIFTSDNEWAAQVCEAIIARDTGVAWSATNGIRVDSANVELFHLMKRAGCYRVFFGFESGNEQVLRSFGKGGKVSLEMGIEAVEMARAAGIEPDGFFMVGLSGDTEASMQDTIDYAKRVRLETMKCGMCVPYPGTPMFESLHGAGRIKSFDWDTYTVYNQVEDLYDHPTLEWVTITRFFRKFYRDACMRNPGFLWRRLRHSLRNHELFWTAYYTVRFWRGLRSSGAKDEREGYGYEADWRPLDFTSDQPVRVYPVPHAKKVKVTISSR